VNRRPRLHERRALQLGIVLGATVIAVLMYRWFAENVELPVATYTSYVVERMSSAETLPEVVRALPATSASIDAASEKPGTAPMSATRLVTTIQVLTRRDGEVHDLPGAEVELWIPPAPEATTGRRLMSVANPSGLAFFDTTGLGFLRDEVQVRVRADGYATALEWVSLGFESPVCVYAKCRFEGRVLSFETGDPIRDAFVMVLGDGLDAGPLLSAPVAVDLATGRFSLDDVPSRRQFILAIQRPGYLTESRVLECGVSAGIVDLLLAEGRTLAGRVVDVATGEPVAGVRVGERDSKIVSNAVGEFEIGGVGSGESLGSFSFSKSGYCLTALMRVPPDIEATSGLLIPLVRGGRIAGRVTDSAGTPLHGIPIWVEEDFRAARGSEDPIEVRYPGYRWDSLLVMRVALAHSRSTRDGTFLIGGAVSGSYPLRVVAADAESGLKVLSESFVCESGSNPGPIDLRFPRSGSLVGSVTPAIDSGRIEWRGRTSHGRCSVEPDGTFRFERVEEGDVRVELRLGEEVLAFRDLVVHRGTTTSCEFVKTADVAAWHGIVVDGEGMPLPDASVGFDHSVVPRETRTDSNGRFVLHGAAELVATRIRYGTTPARSATREVRLDGTALLLRLPRFRTIELRIVDARTERAVPEVRVRWETVLDGHAVRSLELDELRVDGNGSAFYEVPHGLVTLSIDAGALGFRIVNASLDPNVSVRPIRIALARGE
jgi:hypothetical protein